MEGQLGRSEFLADSSRERTANKNKDNFVIPSGFGDSQCLFCNQPSSNMDQNMVHMSKAHGLYIDLENLLVDIGSLLAYCHLVISERYECLYCGTQRNTRQAVQQHMMDKGHCKMADAELRDFYEKKKGEPHQNLYIRFSDDAELPSHARSRKPRPPERPDRHGHNVTVSPPHEAIPTGGSTDAESSSNTDETPSHSLGDLSTRALKHEYTLNNQLARLRADDRRSLSHLPASQQRALLATHHKQMEKARRTEQIQRGNLECAGNHFSRLGTIRLIRKPPHTGNVHSLNR